MDPLKFNVYTSLSSLTDEGMTVFYNPNIPNIDADDLVKVANYYSIILNFSESKGALYGPLPIAYHTEYLLYIYTFESTNPLVKDERIRKDGGRVPSFLLIFFPTAAEGFTTRAREQISLEISNWLEQFNTINDMKDKLVNKLNSQIEAAIYKQQSIFALDEIEEANVVLGKSIELFHNVLKYQEKPAKILLSGTDELLFSIARKAIFSNNSSLVSYFKNEKNKIDFKLGNVEGTILLTSVNTPNLHKYLSKDLDGVLHFGNFSTPESIDAHTTELSKIIKQTSQDCIISFAISQTDKPIKISETKIPDVLQEGVGRTISLIDMGQQKNTISTTIIEFLEKLIELIGRK